MQKLKHYLRYENEVKRYEILSYCETLFYMQNIKNNEKVDK